MEGIFEFVVSMLPILLGIAAFTLIKKVSFQRRGITIYFGMEDLPVKCDEIYEEHDTERQYIKDEFLVNGIWEASQKISTRRAFDALGIISANNLHMLPELLRKSRPEKIKILAGADKSLLPKILSFSPVSGLLIAYMLEYNLEVIRL